MKFKEDEEAVFFTDTDDLIAKIARWLPDEPGRNRIAAAGCARAKRDGYSNDVQVARIIDKVREIARETGRDVV
jgi:spore maturation protein CgeB